MTMFSESPAQLRFSEFDLTGKCAVVTGAAGLLGRHHVAALLEAGAQVFATDLRTTELDGLRENLTEGQAGCLFCLEMDVTSEESIRGAQQIIETKGFTTDILVNNAAIDPKLSDDSIVNSQRLETSSPEDLQLHFSVGLTGAVLCTKVFGVGMAQKKSGVIINIASDLSVIAPDQRIYSDPDLGDSEQNVKPVAYSIVKHGMVGLTKYTATYWADRGVRCNALSPGGVRHLQSRDLQQRIEDRIPLQRMAAVNEYKGALKFLCSDASKYLNGHNLVMDGGRSIW